MKKSESFCKEAERLINGPRQAAYGHPFDNFTDIGKLWGVILSDYKGGDIDPEKVALCLAALKLARQLHVSRRDNLVDMIGYIANIERIWGHQQYAHKKDASTNSRTSCLIDGEILDHSD